MRKDRTGKWKIGRRRAFAAALAGLLMTALTARPVFMAADTLADALEEGCTVKVTVPAAAEEPDYAELADAGTVLDFYRVAKAVPKADGSDAYDFEWAAAFSAQQAAWEAVAAPVDGEEKHPTAQNVRDLTQGLAGVVLNGIDAFEVGSEGTSASASITGVPVYHGTPGTAVTLGSSDGADPGLYLVIARGNAPKYKITADDGSISTAVPGTTKLYQFAPMLISVPQRGMTALTDSTGTIYDFNTGDALNVYGSWTSNTADTDKKWENALEISAKVGVTDLVTGSLVIRKTLDNYASFEGRTEEVTCIFQVEVEKDGSPVLSSAYSIILDGTKRSGEVTVPNLPIGATATVTEIYAGNYSASEGTQTTVGPITIKADSIAANGDPVTESDPAVFRNQHGGTWRGGGSVTNTYKTTEKADGNVDWDFDHVEQSYAHESGSGK